MMADPSCRRRPLYGPVASLDCVLLERPKAPIRAVTTRVQPLGPRGPAALSSHSKRASSARSSASVQRASFTMENYDGVGALAGLQTLGSAEDADRETTVVRSRPLFQLEAVV